MTEIQAEQLIELVSSIKWSAIVLCALVGGLLGLACTQGGER